MKRIFIALISLCTIVSAYADDDVIEIWNKAQLIDFSNAVNDVEKGNDFYGKTVKLMADITIVEDDNWIPIGKSEQRWDEEHLVYVKDDTHVFKGTFDGQGNTITIYVNSKDFVALGLFGYLYGTVQHLKVEGNITNGLESTSSTAGIAAYNRGTIDKCANLAHIIGTTAGGIAGENHGKITNCYNLGNILAAYGLSEGNYHLGGIAGIFKGTEISNVYASCEIDDVNDPGGIVPNIQSGTLSNGYYYVQVHGYSGDYHIGNVEDEEKENEIKSFEGNILDGKLNTANDYSIWTFTDGQLPELTCFVISLSDNSDNSSILTSYDGKKRTVLLSGRTLYRDGYWNTLCLPLDLGNASALDGHHFDNTPLEGAIVKEMDTQGSDLTDNKLTLSFNPAESIVAGKPYIIKWDNPGEPLSNVMFRDVTVKNKLVAVTSDDRCVTFEGTYSPFSIGDTSTDTYDGDINEIILLSSDNTLGYSKNPRTLRSCRAHFMIPTSAGIRAMLDFDIDFGNEEVTAIANLKSQISSLKPESWFTLTGMKLDGKPTQRGIYLHNGRKEAVR